MQVVPYSTTSTYSYGVGVATNPSYACIQSNHANNNKNNHLLNLRGYITS